MPNDDRDVDGLLLEALEHAKLMASLTDNYLRHALASNLRILPMNEKVLDVLLFATLHTQQLTEAAQKLLLEKMDLLEEEA